MHTAQKTAYDVPYLVDYRGLAHCVESVNFWSICVISVLLNSVQPVLSGEVNKRTKCYGGTDR